MARKKAEETEEKTKPGYLPDMAPPSIPEIEEAAEAYVKARNKWQRAHEPMIEAQEILHDKMRLYEKKRYEFDGKIVELIVGEKVKVKAAKEESESDEQFP